MPVCFLKILEDRIGVFFVLRGVDDHHIHFLMYGARFVEHPNHYGNRAEKHHDAQKLKNGTADDAADAGIAGRIPFGPVIVGPIGLGCIHYTVLRMVVPPLEQQHDQRNRGDVAPQFEIGAVQCRGGNFGVFAELQIVSRFYVAFIRVEQRNTKCRVVGAGFQMINALMKRIAEYNFVRLGIHLQSFDRPIGQRDLRVRHRLRQREVKGIAGANEQLAIAFGGRVQPLDGIGDEDGKGNSIRPGAFQGVEADPQDALAAQFPRDDERRFG